MHVPRDRQKLGRVGEDIAAKYLAANGYTVLARNYRRAGAEADIVCRAPDGCLVFAEVKARTFGTFGEGFEAVGRAKQKQIVRASLAYISEHMLLYDYVRYDVIIITLGHGKDGNTIDHLVNAFDAR